MEIIRELSVSQYGLSLDTCLIDIYIHIETIWLVLGLVIVLRIRKVLKQKKRNR